MHNRQNLSEQDGTISSRSVGEERTAEQISPPPLKRQRSGPGAIRSRVTQNEGRASPISFTPGRRAAHSNFVVPLRPPLHDPLGPHGEPGRSRHSLPSSNSLLPHNSQSSKSKDPKSNRLSASSSSNKPVCQVCLKGTNVKYDPIITCAGCHTCYHDSCRKPSPVEGIDRQTWRCFKCLSGDGKGFSKSRRSLASLTDAHAPTHLKLTERRAEASQHTVGAQETTARRKIARVAAERKDLDTRRGSLGHDGTPTSLDGYIDQPERVGEIVHPPQTVEHVSKLSGSGPRIAVAMKSSSDELKLQAKSAEFSKDTIKAPASRMFDVDGGELVEIPNTPTQRSSQLQTPGPLPKLRGCGVEETDDISPNIGLKSAAKLARISALCSLCQKQRVLTRGGSTDVVCRSCRRISNEKIEIPESPEADESDPETGKRSTTISRATLPPLQTAADHAPRLWFQTGLINPTTKIKRKKVGQPTSKDIGHQPQPATEHRPSLSPHRVAPLHHDAGVTLQDFVPQSNSESNVITGDLNTASLRTPRALIQDGQAEQQPAKDSKLHEFTTDVSPQLSQDETGSTSTGSASTSSSEEGEDVPTPGSVLANVKGSDVGSKSKTLRLAETTMESPTLGIHLQDIEQAAVEKSANCTVPTSKRQYTMRQLARIALVAANGDRITTAQIISWLAQTFSYLKVGKGGWEMQVRSCLSHFAEFRSTKIAGSHLKLYDFADAETRAQYEAEHSEFLTASKPTLTLKQSEQDTTDAGRLRKDGQKQLKRAVKSAPTMPPSFVDLYPRAKNTSSRNQPDIRAKETKGDTGIVPFERSTPRKPFHLLDADCGVVQQTTFENTTPPIQQVSIETMTKAEKISKIEQIKARPSRKIYFGSGHRLAHKRWHNLENIHDERDGAWKPLLTTAHESTNRIMDDFGDGGSRTLRQVLNLPSNMIPVNDGKTELAFKDGAQLGGRSARSRTIYKVGKMFGGELTVRTS